MIREDLEFLKGEDFAKTFTMYSDPRLELWRGTWKEWYVYLQGHGVVNKGLPYVALLRTQHAEPGTPGVEPFWSPLEPANLTGSTAKIVADGAFEEPITIVPLEGKLLITVPHAKFASAPESTRYYVKVTDELGASIFPLTGAALFREP